MSVSYLENQLNQILWLFSFASDINSFILEMTLSFSTVSTISTNAPVSPVSLHKKKSVSSFKDLLKITKEYDFATDARSYLKKKGKHLICAATPFMMMYGTIKGEFCTPWKTISNAGRRKMCQKLTEKASWLLYFEQEWASDWILFWLINQQVWDRNWRKWQGSDNEMTEDDIETEQKSED